MTRRPGADRRRASVTPQGVFFPDVAIPAHVLDRARAESGVVDAAEVVEAFLRSAHGPEPHHRDDRERWLAYDDATQGRAFELAQGGLLA